MNDTEQVVAQIEQMAAEARADAERLEAAVRTLRGAQAPRRRSPKRSHSDGGSGAQKRRRKSRVDPRTLGRVRGAVKRLDDGAPVEAVAKEARLSEATVTKALRLI